MKKALTILFIAIFSAGLLFIAPNKAQATSPADGNWNTGTEIKIDLEKNPAPNKWVDLLTQGVQVDKKTEICHPFRGAQFHWVPEIHRLVKGQWTKLETTIRRIPNNEGPFWACANAQAAGTYALFGYYNGPREYFNSQPPACIPMDGWEPFRGSGRLYVSIDNLDDGAVIHFKQITTDSHIELDAPEGDATVQTDEEKFAPLTTYNQVIIGEWSIDIEVSYQGCSRVFTFTGGGK